VIIFDSSKKISGKGCRIALKSKKVIIQSNVKSRFGEVAR
jgi:predicted RNA-binding protein